MENSISLKQSLMVRLGLDWGCIGNEGRLDWRFGHGYDSALPLGLSP